MNLAWGDTCAQTFLITHKAGPSPIVIIIIIHCYHHHPLSSSSSSIVIIIIIHCHHHYYHRHPMSSSSLSLSSNIIIIIIMIVIHVTFFLTFLNVKHPNCLTRCLICCYCCRHSHHNHSDTRYTCPITSTCTKSFPNLTTYRQLVKYRFNKDNNRNYTMKLKGSSWKKSDYSSKVLFYKDIGSRYI